MEEASISDGLRQIESYGFREVESTDQSLSLDREDIPWLPDKDERDEPQVGIMVPLALVTQAGGEQFYCGSAIKGDTLIEEADSLGSNSEKANKLFYTAIQHHLNKDSGVKVLHESVTELTKNPRKIYYASNGRGAVRTYFMRMKEREGKPVFLRIAASGTKNSEVKVLSILTQLSKDVLKKRCIK
jgi:hypothetical protein